MKKRGGDLGMLTLKYEDEDKKKKNGSAWLMSFAVAVGASLMVVGLASAQQSDVRIDTFDKQSNRTGYIIVNPNTGRLDQFDKNSNRLGYGTVMTPSSGGTRIDTYSNNGTRSSYRSPSGTRR
jgi:hypothetical protein